MNYKWHYHVRTGASLLEILSFWNDVKFLRYLKFKFWTQKRVSIRGYFSVLCSHWQIKFNRDVYTAQSTSRLTSYIFLIRCNLWKYKIIFDRNLVPGLFSCISSFGLFRSLGLWIRIRSRDVIHVRIIGNPKILNF